jgi:hypothetical protein
MATPPKNTKAQTFIVDTDLSPQIQMILAQSRIAGKSQKYKSISDFVNQAIRNQLMREAK